jgi:hypothetical protein
MKAKKREGPVPMDPHMLIATALWCPCGTDMVHVANGLYLCSYLVRDILWLRVLTILAGLSLLPFYGSCSDHILWAPIAWNLVFMTVNVVQIGLLIHERRPQLLFGPEQELYRRIFADLTPGEFRKLMKHGEWREIEPVGTIVRRDTVVRDMQVLWKGAVTVRAGGRVIAQLRPGQFVGEMSFLSGEKATADVIAAEPSSLLAWSQESLNELLEKQPALGFKIRGILGRDVVTKLRAHG